MLIKDGTEYFSEHELCDILQVRPSVIHRMYWDGALPKPLKLSEYGLMYWTREQAEKFLGHRIDNDFYKFTVHDWREHIF
ncbi:MAG: hypothetical protein IJP48_09810 [Synergistaceae bacterium]|nr:hypothetical protein [Synergistaceae bacterium]